MRWREYLQSGLRATPDTNTKGPLGGMTSQSRRQRLTPLLALYTQPLPSGILHHLPSKNLHVSNYSRWLSPGEKSSLLNWNILQ